MTLIELQGKAVYRVLSTKQFNTRIQNVNALEPLKLCPTAKCFTNKYLNYILGLRTSEEIDKELEPILAKMNRTYIDRFFSIMQKGNEKIKEDISETLSYLNSNTRTSLGHGIAADMKANHFISKLNEYMREYIDYKSITNFQYLFSNSCKLVENLEIHNSYHSIDITIDGIDLTVIFNRYTLNNEDDSESKLIITNIVPKENTINKYGVYNKILSVGILIYKVFEYNELTNTRGTDEYSNYVFIGNYLGNLELLRFIKDTYFS
jgi:hypothetical protein